MMDKLSEPGMALPALAVFEYYETKSIVFEKQKRTRPGRDTQ
jgi:hypothetical protein